MNLHISTLIWWGWALNSNDSKGKALEMLEDMTKSLDIFSQLSQEDIDVSFHYYKAQEFNVDKEVLEEIFMQAPLFKNYHNPTDLSCHLSEESLKMAETVVYETFCKLSY